MKRFFYPITVFFWWYTYGMWNLLARLHSEVRFFWYGLAIRPLWQNLFSPLYGLDTWGDRLISFIVRFGHFSVLFMAALLTAGGVYAFFLAYLSVPVLIFYFIEQEVYIGAGAVYVSMLLIYIFLKECTKRNLKHRLPKKQPKNLLKFAEKDVVRIFKPKKDTLLSKISKIFGKNISGDAFLRMEMPVDAYKDFEFHHHEDTLLKTALKISAERGKKSMQIIDVLEALWTLRIKNDPFWNRSLLKKNIKGVFDFYDIKKDLADHQKEWTRYSFFQNKYGIDRGLTAKLTKKTNEFTRDVTRSLSSSSITYLVDRKKEWEMMLENLKHKGNAVLIIGESGVGKSRLVEHLSEKIAANKVPYYLKEKRVVELDAGRVLSGDVRTESGEGGKNLISVLDEISGAQHIILTIDNLITLAGENFSSVFLLGILTKYIENKKIYLVATSTKEDYQRFLQHHPSYVRWFTKIHLDELSLDQTREVMMLHAVNMEKKYRLMINQQCYETILEITQKHMTQVANPANALHILEETVAANASKDRITSEDVKLTIEKNTGIKITKIAEEEKKLLVDMESEIKKTIVSQEAAVRKVSDALRRARLGLHDYEGPIAKFLFIGPTGVGKTELTKTVARIHFGSEKKILRLDMSEFQDVKSIGRLIGDDVNPGLLTEPVRATAHMLVLLDEIEKAHPNILNLFLQLLDDGRITDGRGKVVDFRNTMIIATSNAGAEYLWQGLKDGKPFDEIEKHLKKEILIKHFKPEFLNRFNHVITFRPLEKDEVVLISEKLLKKAKKMYAEKNIRLDFTEDAAKVIAHDSFTYEMGARPLKHAIVDRLESGIARAMLEKGYSEGGFVFDGRGVQ